MSKESLEDLDSAMSDGCCGNAEEKVMKTSSFKTQVFEDIYMKELGKQAMTDSKEAVIERDWDIKFKVFDMSNENDVEEYCKIQTESFNTSAIDRSGIAILQDEQYQEIHHSELYSQGKLVIFKAVKWANFKAKKVNISDTLVPKPEKKEEKPDEKQES